jgi:hypothetical protein
MQSTFLTKDTQTFRNKTLKAVRRWTGRKLTSRAEVGQIEAVCRLLQSAKKAVFIFVHVVWTSLRLPYARRVSQRSAARGSTGRLLHQASLFGDRSLQDVVSLQRELRFAHLTGQGIRPHEDCVKEISLHPQVTASLFPSKAGKYSH